MKILQTTVFWIALLVLRITASAQTREETPAAEPHNVMVDRFTFTRPQPWKWVPNSDASTAAVRFVVLNKNTESSADVRLYISEKSASEAIAVWKSFYVNNSSTTYDQRTEKTGKYEVTWLSITGTHKDKNKSKGITKYVGVIIPLEKRNLLIRHFGPKAEVDEAMIDFQKMIQDALTEE